VTKKRSALAALGAFEAEQRARDKQAEELRRAAALELGYAVLDAGGGALALNAVRKLIEGAVRDAAKAAASALVEPR
jgi:hypothetical protein